MIFAIAMDYTVFLLASAKEHYERTGDPRDAMVGALAHSGRVIFAAGAVMVAVFFTFALSGPLPPKEMGIVLGVAVLLDASLVRLVLLPVLLRLTGRAAWWSPAWLRTRAARHPLLPRVERQQVACRPGRSRPARHRTGTNSRVLTGHVSAVITPRLRAHLWPEKRPHPDRHGRRARRPADRVRTGMTLQPWKVQLKKA